jgi:hypothetical protein
MKLSVWLLPPPHARPPIRAHINHLAQLPGASVPFEPHVTITGGIHCISLDEVEKVAAKLQAGLRGFGKVPVKVEINAQGHAEQWNQALYLPVQASAEFVELCRATRQIVGLSKDSAEEFAFPPPAKQPHLSLFYGNQGVPNDHKQSVDGAQCSFVAEQVALWITDPSSVEGVAQWKELAVIDLC